MSSKERDRLGSPGRAERVLLETESRMEAAQIRECLCRRIATWPGVEVRTHAERGDRFCVNRGEFLHFHGDRQMDVRLDPKDRDAVLNSGHARFHPRGHEGGWVMAPLAETPLRTLIRMAGAAYRWRRSR